MMLVIHREKGSIVKGTHYIYTVEEADELGIQYMHWKDGLTGDWVVSDDGYVLECLLAKEYYDSRRSKISRYDVYSIFYTYCGARSTSWSKHLFIARHLRGMTSLDGKTWQERWVVSRKGRSWIKLAASMMLHEKKLDYMVLGEFLGFDKKYPDSTYVMTRRYLRDPLIENTIFLQMSEFLNDNEITAQSVLDDYKKIKDSAIKDGKYTDAIKILEKFERWAGLEQKISGDKIEHGAGQDMIGSRVEKMLQSRMNGVQLPGTQRKALKIPGSWSQQVEDIDGNRVEYIEINEQAEAAVTKTGKGKDGESE
jgi:hypothetical protein